MSRGKGSVDKRGLYEFLAGRDGLVCGICKKTLISEWNKYEVWLLVSRNKLIKRKDCDITIDHIVPKSRIRHGEGWKYTKGWWYSDTSNLQLAHYSCNNKKGNTYETLKNPA